MFKNSKYFNEASWNLQKNTKPFPFIFIDNFLKSEIYLKITEKFPTLNHFATKGDINGNNTQIRMAYYEFSNNLDSYWHDFGSYFLNEDFFYDYCGLFENEIRYWYPEIYEKIRKKNLKIGISNIDSFENYDVLLDFQLGINTSVKEMTSVRGPHLDNRKSLYTALCYLKDNDDNTDSGHFTVYDLKPYKFLKLGKSRSINLSDVKIFKEIKYKSNRLATFINTKKSIHGVSQREVTNKIRKFFAFNAVIRHDLYKISLPSRVLGRFHRFFDKKMTI